MFRKHSRVIAAAVLCFFTWTSGGLFSVAHAAQDAVRKAKVQAPAKKSAGAEERFLKLTEELTAELLDPKKDHESRKQRLAAGKSELAALDADIRKQFAATEQKLKTAGLPAEILARHARFVKHYDDNLNELKGNIERVEKATGKGEIEKEIEKTRQHLAKVKAPSRHQKLDPNNLPHRQPKAVKREPRLRKEEFDRDLLKDKHAWKQAQRIIVAANGSVAGLLSPDDLAETVEVQLSPEIRAKALELGNNPVKIYEWVRNNIDYVPTWGSIQGANMTMQTKQGNAFDTSSLLIALLRAAGINARYVVGTIELPLDQMLNWVGGFSDPAADLEFMQSGGIPVRPVIEGGTITKVQLEHVWVDAWINYVPSRGVKHIQGKGDTWISLDPSFKQYTHKAGIDLATAVPIASTAFIDAGLAPALSSAADSYATKVNCAPVREAVGDQQLATARYLSQNLPDTAMAAILGSDEKIKEEFPYLLGTLPYTVVVTGIKVPEIPAALRYQLTFTLVDQNGLSLELRKSLPELAGRKITLDYKPATPADAATITAFPSGVLPAYLINVRPELRIDGLLVASGAVTGLGRTATLTVTTAEPEGGSDLTPLTVAAGEYLAFAIDTGRVAQQQLITLKDTLTATQQQLATLDVTALTKDLVLGDPLYAAALAYFAQLDTIGQLRAKTSAVAVSRLPSIACAAAQLAVTLAYDTPLAVSGGGLTLEVPRKVTAVQPLDGNRNRQLQSIFTAGIDAAFLTKTVASGFFPADTAISPVTALQAASDAGTRIYTVNQANLHSVLPQLQLSAALQSDISSAVTSGKTAIVSGAPLTVSGWSGTPGLVIDPATADSAWFLGDDSRGALLHPAWEGEIGALLVSGSAITSPQAAAAANLVAQPLSDGLHAVVNGIDTLTAGMPAAYLEELTSGQFYRIIASGLGCYFTATPPPVQPSTACMGSFL